MGRVLEVTPEERREAYAIQFAALLDLIRAEHALSQADLARKLETDRGTVCRLLKGHDIRVSTLLWFLDVMGYEVTFTRKCVGEKTAA